MGCSASKSEPKKPPVKETPVQQPPVQVKESPKKEQPAIIQNQKEASPVKVVLPVAVEVQADPKEDQVKYQVGYDKIAPQYENFLSENTKKFQDTYKQGQLIFSEQNGDVFKVTLIATGQQRTMKKIPKTGLSREEQKQKTVNDLLILRALDHPNIVKAFEFFQDDKNYYVVGEISNGGSIQDRIESASNLTEKEVSNVIRQLLEVVVYTHALGISHRNLSPNCIRIDLAQGGDVEKGDYNIKVFDWEYACKFTSEPMTAEVGVLAHSSPETVGKKYTQSADIWTVGSIIYYLLCGEPLFQDDSPEQVAAQITNSQNWDFPKDELWNSISADAKDLMKKLMKYNASERLSPVEALNHRWVQNAPKTVIKAELRKECFDRMKDFRVQNVLQNAVLTYITSNLVDNQDKQYLLDVKFNQYNLQTFKAMDKDGSGTLSKQEIENFYKDTMDGESLKNLLSHIADGPVNYTEFINTTIDKKKSVTQERLKQAFDYFDTDSNGFITSDEMNKFIGTQMKEKDGTQWQKLIEEADSNKDGKLSFEEFSNMVLQMVPK